MTDSSIGPTLGGIPQQPLPSTRPKVGQARSQVTARTKQAYSKAAPKGQENVPKQWKRGEVSVKKTSAASPKLETRERAKEAELIRANIRSYFSNVKLSSGDEKKIDLLVERLIKVDVLSKKVRAQEPTKLAPFGVHKVEKITIGGVRHTFELGRDFKVVAHAVNETVVGSGGYGNVSKVGTLLKQGIPIMKKVGNVPESSTPPDLLHEMRYTQELHLRAGGHQRGVQRAPFRLFNVKSHTDDKYYGYYVPGYITDMSGKKLMNLTTAEKSTLGLNTARGLVTGALDLCTGLEATHKLKIAHRDLKPGNIGIQLRDKDVTKSEWAVADYGLATKAADEEPLGTPVFITDRHLQLQHKTSGEKRKEHQRGQDIYALGLSLLEIYYTALTGELVHYSDQTPWRDELMNYVTISASRPRKDGMPKHPADCPHVKDLLTKIENSLGTDVALLLRDMLEIEPQKPLTATEIRTRLEAIVQNMGSDADTGIYPVLPNIGDILQKAKPGAVFVSGPYIYVKTQTDHNTYQYSFIQAQDGTYSLVAEENPPRILLEGLKSKQIPASFLATLGESILTVDKRLQALQNSLPDALKDKSNNYPDHVALLDNPNAPPGSFMVWKPYNYGIGPKFLITVKGQDGALIRYSITLANNVDKTGFFISPLDTDQDAWFEECSNIDNLLNSMGLEQHLNYTTAF